jgi:chromosome segregation ATPase
LLILEIEKNLDLKESLSKREEMVEALTRELSLAKATIEEKDVELAKAKSSMVDLEGVNYELQSNISSLHV